MQQVDDPPSLPVGTEVSAKYKGAFCEAKVRKVVRNIKVKVAYKQPGLGSGIVPDDAIKSGTLRVGATVEIRHPERREIVEATITKIQDGSQYTVVFDDGDITTLRRTALCLKSGRHFNASETLDQLPLTHPEHFSNPVIGGRRGRRSRHLHDDSSDEEDEPVKKGKANVNEKEENIGTVVCVESTEAKKKDKYFPGLVVAPTAQVTVKIRVKDEYLVRSFKDGRYYTVPKKEAIEFTRELAAKMDGPAVQAALEFLEHNQLPPHWDRDSLYGLSNSSSDYEGEVDSDTSDDEPTEEKDHFVAQLYKYMDDRGTPLNKVPSIQNRDVDLYRLFRTVQKLGGYNRVTSQNQWKSITIRLGFTPVTVSVTNLVKQAYKKFLQPYEEFHRKLGCSMLMTPRGASRTKGRSLVRANSVASPKPETKTSVAAIAAAAVAAANAVVAANASAAAATITTSNSISASDSASSSKQKQETEDSENTSESSIEAPIKTTKRKISTGSNKVKALVEKFEEKNKEESNKTQQIEQEQTKPVLKEKPPKEIPKEREVTPPPPPPPPILVKDSPPSTMSSTSSNNKAKEKNLKQIKPEDKRGRKKRDSVEPPPVITTEKPPEKPREPPPVFKNDFPVEVGDKLKVYYHEKRVTYEAKVIEISLQQGTPLYMVHYTGWNNRYDEWIPKERIAENLTNSKVKKSKVSQGTQPAKPGPDIPPFSKTSSEKEKLSQSIGPTGQPPTPSTGPGPNTIKSISASKRGRGRSDSQPPRSTTPSSVASNSSRTKSPATPATNQRRITRTQPSSNIRRTSTNVSDISIQTDSDSDSDEPVLKKPTRSSTAAAAVAAASNNQISSGSKSQSTLKSSNTSPSETEEDESAKGRDYDLNQIRSELKGFKELKSPSPEPEDKKSEKLFDFSSTKEKPDSGIKSPTAIVTSKMESKSSTDLSSESDSFGDDDSQSSDKTTQLENMTEKLQQKIKAEKLAAQAAAAKSLDKFSTGGKSISVEKLSPLSSSGIEKIIKDSLAEKRQETLKASKPFLIEKSIFKSSNIIAPTITSQEKIDKPLSTPPKLMPSNILKTETPTRAQLTRQTSAERKAAILSAMESKKPQVNLIDTKIHPGLRGEKKPILTSKANSALQELSTTPTKKDILTPPTSASKITTSDAKLTIISDVKITPAFQHKANINLASTPEKQSMGLISKSNLSKDILKTSGGKSLQTLQPSTSTANTSDIYEFKEPEPFEFEARKTSSVSHCLGQSFDIEKKKKPSQKSFEQLEIKSLPTSQQSLVSLVPQVTITPAGKKTKKSPIKESAELKSAKQIKLEEKSPDVQPLTLSALSIQITTASNTSISTTSSYTFTSSFSALSVKPDTTFDVLRKSPSFNLNINALNEELATTVQETTKALTDVSLSSLSIPITPSTTIVSNITPQKPTFISSFVEAIKSPITQSKISPATIKVPTPLIKTPSTTTTTSGFVSISKPILGQIKSISAISKPTVVTSKPVISTTKSIVSTSKAIIGVSKPIISTPKSIPSTSKSILSSISIPPPVIAPQDILNVFELKQDHDSNKSGSDDDHDKIKKSKELETVKKMLLSDTGMLDLEPPKIEKPSSIADKVLKALNQKKEEEEKTKDNMPEDIKPSVVSLPQKPLLPKALVETNIIYATPIKSPIPFSGIPPNITAISNTSNSASIFSTNSIIINEPPKIEMPILIKKDFENALQKPILNSPEHKLDILESIAPKNNDLTETIQKLESAISKTSNVDHFDADSSDSTDSERRLVIEDDESSDNHANDTLSAPEYSPLKKPDIITSSPLKSLNSTLLLPQTSIVLKSSDQVTIFPKSDISTKKPNEHSIFSLSAPNTTTVTAIGPHGNATSVFGLQASLYANPSLLCESGIKPLSDMPNFKQDLPPSLSVTAVKRSEMISPPDLSITVLKKDDNNSILQDAQNVASDSINLLLCEETIPGSPTPVPTKEMLLEQNIKISGIHPTESNIKPIPMDIECSPNMPSSSSSSRQAQSCSTKIVTKVEQTPSSSPHDSQSQDDSSEDLKKQLCQDLDDVSPKKRRRTRTHSEVQRQIKRGRNNRGDNTAKKNNGSDSDDNSDTNTTQRSSSNRPIRPCPYNFLVQLDSALNPNQRISILRKKITDLRKTYNSIKAELASIDRRRKKLRRREREKKQQQKQQQQQQQPQQNIQSPQQFNV